MTIVPIGENQHEKKISSKCAYNTGCRELPQLLNEFKINNGIENYKIQTIH